jgi:hypothetical protein
VRVELGLMKHTMKTFILPLLLLVSAVAVLTLTAANKTGHFGSGLVLARMVTIGVVELSKVMQPLRVNKLVCLESCFAL